MSPWFDPHVAALAQQGHFDMCLSTSIKRKLPKAAQPSCGPCGYGVGLVLNTIVSYAQWSIPQGYVHRQTEQAAKLLRCMSNESIFYTSMSSLWLWQQCAIQMNLNPNEVNHAIVRHPPQPSSLPSSSQSALPWWAE